MSDRFLQRGSGFLLVSAFLEGLTPVLMHRASGLFPPAFFLLCVNAIAAVLLTIMLTLRGELPFRISRDVFLAMLGVGFFIYGGYMLLLFGTKYSSGVSTTILLQSEMLWVFLFSWLILKERITGRRILGACITLLGTLAVLWKGEFSLGNGELLIVAGTALYPVGNACAQRAMRTLPPRSVLLLRYCFGMLFLLPLSLLLGETWSTALFDAQHLVVLLPCAVLVFTISKICWYEGLSRNALHVATSAMAVVPAFSLLFAYIILREIPTTFQWLGFSCTILGMWLLLRERRAEQVLP